MSWTASATVVPGQLMDSAFWNAQVRDNLLYLYSLARPIGSIFAAVVSTNPNTLLGYGTWAAFGAGRTLVCVDPAQTEFNTVEKTGGAKTHTLTLAEFPPHPHNYGAANWSGGRVITPGSEAGNFGGAAQQTGNTGGGGAHNNLQPSIAVYLWKRTA